MQPSHFFKRHAGQFIYQETAAVNDRKSGTIYWRVRGHGGGGGWGLRMKPEVSAWPVRGYKALLVAHDLFMAGWDAAVRGSWSLKDRCRFCITSKPIVKMQLMHSGASGSSSALLPHEPQTRTARYCLIPFHYAVSAWEDCLFLKCVLFLTVRLECGRSASSCRQRAGLTRLTSSSPRREGASSRSPPDLKQTRWVTFSTVNRS